MIRLLLLFWMFCLPALLKAQQQLVFEHYGRQQGFNSRTSRTVAKTTDGMIWITTDDGLVRFDSKTFKYYQHNVSDTASLSNNLTDQMVTDNKNRLWIVTGAGIDVFDPVTESFSNCFLLDNGKVKKDFSPESLFYDKELDIVWTGTHHGLYYCETGSRQLRKARADAASADLIDLVFIDIRKDKKGLLWLCNEFGFFSYAPGNGHLTQYHVPDQKDEIANDDGAFCLFPDDSIVWVGTWIKGLVKYDLKTGRGVHYYYTDPKAIQNGISFIARTGRSSEQHLLWLSTASMGLAVFDTRMGRFTFYNTTVENDKNGIRGTINRMLPTSTEGMWIAAENGLHRYDYSQQLFSLYDLTGINPSLINAPHVEFLNFQPAEDGSDSLCWFNIPYYGPYCYNLKKKQFVLYPPLLKEYFNASVFSCYLDKRQVLWVATDKYGLIGYDIQKQRIRLFEQKYFSGAWEWVTDFKEDSKGRLWLATYNGLFLLDENREKVNAIAKVNNLLKQQNLSLNISGVAEDARGRIWITVTGNSEKKNAVLVYDVAGEKALLINNKKADLLPGAIKFNNVACSGNQVFIATTNGLLHFNANDKEPVFSLLSTQNGLINNLLRQVIADQQGNIWCSTVFGVSCYFPEKNFFLNYSYTTSGIGAQKMPYIYLSRHSGNLYLGQQGGFNRLDPADISVQTLPKVTFTGMQLFNKPFLYKQKQLLPGDVIRLRHDQNMVAVEFTGMCFSNAEDNRYAFRLDGLEEEWNVSKNNIAAYTNLSPGKYTLLVKASNSSGTWTQEPSSIVIIIKPPYWKTWWFISLVAIIIISGLYAFYRYRINQLLHIQRIRNTISRNLHDEIGSTLTSISILSNVSRQAIDKDPVQVKDMLEKIAGQSKAIQQNMSDIVWAIRSDNDRVENLLVRIREYAAQTLEPLQVKTVINVDEALLNKTLSLEKRKEILLICKEALNNAAKHSGASMVEVNLQNGGQHLLLEVKDNGRWKGGGSNTGTGLSSIKQRAAAVQGSAEFYHNEEGTTVAVSIPIT